MNSLLGAGVWFVHLPFYFRLTIRRCTYRVKPASTAHSWDQKYQVISDALPLLRRSKGRAEEVLVGKHRTVILQWKTTRQIATFVDS